MLVWISPVYLFSFVSFFFVLFFWKLIIIDIPMQNASTKFSITQELCCIEVVDQEERLLLLPREAGKK